MCRCQKLRFQRPLCLSVCLSLASMPFCVHDLIRGLLALLYYMRGGGGEGKKVKWLRE